MDNMPVSASVTLQIPFHDVDMMCVAWHGHYVKYFEAARCALLDQIQYNYQEMKDSGYAWPVVDLKVKYLRPAQFGQTIKVICQLKEYENRLVLSYLIIDPQTHQKLTKGETTQVAVAMASGEMQLVSPPVLLKKLGLPC